MKVHVLCARLPTCRNVFSSGGIWCINLIMASALTTAFLFIYISVFKSAGVLSGGANGGTRAEQAPLGFLTMCCQFSSWLELWLVHQC